MGEELTQEVAEKRVLHWNYRGFTCLPDELRKGEAVEEIYLKWNNVTHLQNWIGSLKSLTNLYLQNNQLTTLPEEIRELSQLHVLDVSYNILSMLPRGIGQLCNLRQFLAAKNTLQSLPDEFQLLQSLEILDLSNNCLCHLPKSVVDCQGLQQLLMDGNHLTCLPDNIVYLPHLVILSVSSNDLLFLPHQPFLSNPILCFENNPNLNYISMLLGEQINLSKNSSLDNETFSWNLTGAEGCFGRVPSQQYPKYVTIYVKDEKLEKGVPLILPSSLQQISSGKCSNLTVPPLLELTLQKVYTMNCKHTIKVENSGRRAAILMTRTALSCQNYDVLPIFLQQQLKAGPIALCYSSFCQRPIFTYGVLWVVLKDCYFENGSHPQLSNIHATVLFCSINCCLSYDRCEKEKLISDTLEKRKMEWTRIK